MKRLFGAVVVGALIVAPAFAAPAPTPTPAPPPRLFLSPSGEPFRLGPTVPDPLRAWFDQADANHDGAIDRAEFEADATRFFKRLDENSDGQIDGFEAADYESKVAPELAEMAEGRLPGQFGPRGGQSGGHAGGGEHRGGPGGAQNGGRHTAPQGRIIGQLINEPEPVTGADFDLDSHITYAEWMRATDQRFDLLDTAKTGRLTLEALRARMTVPAGPKH